jgi:hypothetical protein
MALVPAQNKGQLMERNNGPLVATEQALNYIQDKKGCHRTTPVAYSAVKPMKKPVLQEKRLGR